MIKNNPQTKLALIQDDPWLEPYEREIYERYDRYRKRLTEIMESHGSLLNFAHVHQYLGFNYDEEKKGWWYREWAPAAYGLFLVGDFNQWDRSAHPLQKNERGIWEIFLPDAEYRDSFTHGSLVKVHIKAANGEHDRLPAFSKRAVQNDETKDFTTQIWNPEKPFEWTDQAFRLFEHEHPVIYEAHVGMATEAEGIGSYRDFADKVLPRVQDLGYNCIQLMAIQEHPYYGSFGYHVSNFYAPSSRFGTPEDLKYLVNKAHEMGIAVVMDIVHSHAVKNFAEGLNEFDGTDGMYFHEGGRGYHNSWDSRLFNYGKPEVQQFLLSNITYWIEEFHFDGFRFDGVTSMLYLHHGDFEVFDHYDKYFKDGVEWDALIYLQLANEVVHRLKPKAITIAEDMSGMPGLCRKMPEGGLGFDYRLAMAVPDYWIKLLKHKSDEEWNIYELWHEVTNRRYKEKTVSYAESHDQALVGDKTIAFWLMDKEMYWHMTKGDENIIIDRGIALHKMIRLISGTGAGESYMNFIGNEFGHPEWVDFPREGNNWSYKYSRRQWSLVDNKQLKYEYLNNFDRAMIHLIKDEKILQSYPAKQLNMDHENNVIIYERNNLIFVFNFHPSNSIWDYRFYVPQAGSYKIILNSDGEQFGGHKRIDDQITYDTNDSQQLSIYLTSRTALIMQKVEK